MTFVELSGVYGFRAQLAELQSHSNKATNSGDGINWPYDPNGPMPDPSQFVIDWNSPDAVKQAEQAYERLLTWVKNHPGCYNGYVMLMQMTVDIGQKLPTLSPAQQKELSSFLSQEIGDGKNTSIFQAMVQELAYAAAITGNSFADGSAKGMDFLAQLVNGTKDLQKFGPPFTTIYNEAVKQQGTFVDWLKTMCETIVDPRHPNEKIFTWLDDQKRPTSFADYTSYIAWENGMIITSDDSTMDDVINFYYQSQIQQLVAQFKGNPWALLMALMNLINQRSEDNGSAINGFGGNLEQLQKANGLVRQMIADITGDSKDPADFFSKMQQLKAMVEHDPALAGLVDQLQADLGTINGQVLSPQDIAWQVEKPGIYHFPPGTKISINGVPYTVPASGEVYLSHAGDTVMIKKGDMGKGFTFGQLADMGASSVIDRAMGDWSSATMSSFENSVTGLQALLNSASPAIQQQIQSVTQTMQAEQNFIKEAFSSITNVNQQIMKMVQQVMG